MEDTYKHLLAALIRENRIASLSTMERSGPYGSLVSYAFSRDFQEYYILASRLARHTKNMEQDPRVSLMMHQPDGENENPLALARVTIQGRVRPLKRGSDEWNEVQPLYMERFPSSEQLFSLSDFGLFTVNPVRGLMVAGPGAIFNLSDLSFAMAARMAAKPEEPLDAQDS